MVDLPQNQIGFVYGIQSLGLIKVGVAMDIERRLETFRLHNPHGCELVFYRRTVAPYIFEKRMHELLADKAVGREWFRVTLDDLRRAASIAKSRANSAQNRLERRMRGETDFGTPVTRAIAEVVENTMKTGTSVI